MGGGTTLKEASRVGCAISGLGINPMPWWIVRQEITDLDLAGYWSRTTVYLPLPRTALKHNGQPHPVRANLAIEYDERVQPFDLGDIRSSIAHI